MLYPNELQKQHLTTKVDLKNIAKAYGIDKIQKHATGTLNVDVYVEENIEQKQGIFLYKRQGENILRFCLGDDDGFSERNVEKIWQ